MISNLTGRVLEKLADSVVVDVGGVGFQVFVPSAVREQVQPGEAISLSTSLIVRQDMLALYGFESRESRQYFSLLLTVEGIGPKLALAILSTLSPDAIRRAIFHEQAEVFTRVSGVGKKTAQKILLQLQDKIPAEAGMERVAQISEVDTEVLGALTSLGYSVVEAQAALQSIPSSAPQDVAERLRLALQFFA